MEKVIRMTQIGLVLLGSTLSIEMMAAPLSLPFGKKVELAAIEKALVTPDEQIIPFIEKHNTDVVLAPVRTILDKEIPKTWIERDSHIGKFKGDIPTDVRNMVMSTHGSAALTVYANNADGIAVSKNTIFTHEFNDSVTLVHEFVRSLMNQGVRSQARYIDMFIAQRNKNFVMNNIQSDWGNMSRQAWRNDVASAMERFVEIFPKYVSETLVEDVIVGRLLADISDKSDVVEFTEEIRNRETQVADLSLKNIIDNYNVTADQFTWVLNEIKSRMPTASGEDLTSLKELQNRLLKAEQKLGKFGAQAASLAKFKCNLATVPSLRCDKF